MIQQITKPFREFFKLEASSGIMLLLAAILALVISNGSYSEEYFLILKKYLKGFVMCWIIAIIYFYRDHLSIAKKVYLTYKNSQSGRSAAW